MKGIYVIAVAFLASWSVCTANQPSVEKTNPQDEIFRKCPYPDINPKNTTTNIAHENDCTKFYKCLLGRGTVQQCPLMWKDDPEKRLHYNRALQVCDWPWEAGCELCPPPDDDGNYPPESLIADPDSSNCRGYITCTEDGRQVRGTCPSGRCFSRTCQGCVTDRENGKCEDISGATPTATPTTSTTLMPKCETGNRTKHYCDCSKFYQCYGDVDWILQHCDGGLHFSATALECMTPDEAKCLKPEN
ncbi:Chitin-binding type-2 domain-containing protein [Camponotus japonicus]